MQIASILFDSRILAVAAALLIGGTALTFSAAERHFVHLATLIDGQDNIDGLARVVSIAVAGDRVYVSSNGDNCLTVLARGGDGNLKVLQHVARDAHSPVPEGAKTIPAETTAGLGRGTVRATKDQRFLFASGDSNILLFERGQEEQLTLRAAFGDPPLTIPYAGMVTFRLSPNERFLYCNRLRDGLIEVIAFDRDGKWMTRVQEMRGLGRCEALAISPDGRNLYAASRTNELLYVFGIDAETGELMKPSEMTANDCGLATLRNVRAVEISPDGNFLFVASVRGTGEISVLKRDSSSGSLTPFQHLSADDGGGEDLNYPVCAAITGDGKTLFLGCHGSRSVVTFRKDDASGMFKYLETIRDLTIEQPTCLAVDNGFLFVCSGEESGALSVFRINAEETKSEENKGAKNE